MSFKFKIGHFTVILKLVPVYNWT